MITVGAGQLLTGRKKLSQETDKPESTIEDWMTLLEKKRMISQKKVCGKHRIITIINWGKYQIERI